MKGNHPKRRRDKYNPYRIYQKDSRYYITFKNGQNVTHEFEISKNLYDVFDYFELESLKYLNVWERHYERGEVWESTLNVRAVHKPERKTGGEISFSHLFPHSIEKSNRTLLNFFHFFL